MNDGLDDGLSMLDVDAVDSVSVSPGHAYAEIWDKLDAARRAIDAATGPQTQATTSGRFDSSSAPVIFSKVPLCPQPHAGIHADPLFACLDVLGDGQPRQFVVYHDKEGWRQLQSKGAGLHSVHVDNSASSFTFSANTARTARCFPPLGYRQLVLRTRKRHTLRPRSLIAPVVLPSASFCTTQHSLS